MTKIATNDRRLDACGRACVRAVRLHAVAARAERERSAPTPATSAPAGALTTNPSSISNPNVSGSLGANPGVPAPRGDGLAVWRDVDDGTDPGALNSTSLPPRE